MISTFFNKLLRRKETLVITDKFFEDSMNGRGYWLRYKVNNSFGSSGAFKENLLPVYEKKYTIDWKQTAMISLNKNK